MRNDRRRYPRYYDDAEHGDGGGAHDAAGMGRWLLTYADMITLLLALFIILFALSTVNAKKFEAFAFGLRQTFTTSNGLLKDSTGLNHQQALARLPSTRIGELPAPGPTAPASPALAGQQSLADIQQELTAALAARHITGSVSSSIQQRGLVVQVLADRVFFQTGSADIGRDGELVVDTIASVLRRNTNFVVVEGYTDTDPVRGGTWTSNMELSAARSANVVVRMYSHGGINENRLSATGYGETHFAAPNDTPAHKARNRRIDVVVLAPGETRP